MGTTTAVDSELSQTVRRIAEVCELTPDKRLRCENDSRARLDLTKEFLQGERSRIDALPTLVALLAADDVVLSVVVAEILALGFAGGFGEEARPGTLPSEVTLGLIEAYNRFDEYRAHRILPAATHAAVLSGDAAKLHAAMVARKDLPGIYRMVRRMMVHGRLSVLPQIRVALADRQDAALALSAMESMRYMEDWSASEQDVLCPLVLRHVVTPPRPLAARAAQVSIHCHGLHLERLLATLRARLDAGELLESDLVALHGRCQERETKPEECEKVVAFLESIAAAKQQSEVLRAAALNRLAAQLPTAGAMPEGFDHALVRRVTRKFGKDQSPAVVGAVKRVTESHQAAL